MNKKQFKPGDKKIFKYLGKPIPVKIIQTAKYGIECEFLASSPPVEKGEKMFCDPTLLFDEETTVRLCGCKEPCFEKGEQWGHLQGVMCKHQSEVDNDTGNGTVCYCLKFKERVEHYSNSYEHEHLLKIEKYGEFNCCGRAIIEKFMDELSLYNIYYNERTSGSSEKVANEQAHIFIINPDKDKLITLHKICYKFSSALNFSTKNAQIEEDGSIGLWIFVKKESANSNRAK